MQIYLVGGAVRDMVLGKKPHDLDYVVFGATPRQMLDLGYEQVGKDFPVFLHPQTHAEYALARKEIKTGKKHTDFQFIFTPDVTPQEDVMRRDFTCNALLYDKNNDKIIDLVGGIADIKNNILRHINSEHFVEDPLRVLRMCRFAAKLNFAIAPETMDLARQMVQKGMLDHLTAERIWKEIESALNTEHFDIFIQTMRDCGALQTVLPEVNKLWDTPERLDYHPEGNSGAHTMLVLQQGYNLSAKIKFALLLHDIGKTATPQHLLPKHIGHDIAGLDLIRKICKRLKVPNTYRNFALLAAEYHMRFYYVPQMRKGKMAAFLATVSGFDDWHQMLDFIRVCRCDLYGRKYQVSPEEQQHFSAAVKRCIINFRIQRKIKATDIPHFAEYPKDKTFYERFMQYRTDFII